VGDAEGAAAVAGFAVGRVVSRRGVVMVAPRTGVPGTGHAPGVGRAGHGHEQQRQQRQHGQPRHGARRTPPRPPPRLGAVRAVPVTGHQAVIPCRVPVPYFRSLRGNQLMSWRRTGFALQKALMACLQYSFWTYHLEST